MADIFEDPKIIQLRTIRDEIRQLRRQSFPPEIHEIIKDVSLQVEQFVQQFLSEREHDPLAALYKVSQALGTSLDLDQVLNQVMDAVIELTGAERGFLMLLDDQQRELSLRAARSIDHTTLEQKDMEVSNTIIRRVLEQGIGVLSTDAQQDPRFANGESIVFFNLRSVMCAPLRARGEIIGVIYVDNRAQSGIFTAGELDMLNAFATQAAIAIENARLYTRTDQALAARVAELETLSKIDRQLNERLDFDRAANITCRWALESTGAMRVWLLRSEEDGSLTRIAGAQDPLDSKLQSCISIAQERCSVYASPPSKKNHAFLAAPVHCSGMPLFVIAIERAEAFTDQSKQFLSRLAGRAGTALENAYLYKAIQEANSAKTKFVSVVTHELRIPMTSIRGYSDLLRQGVGGSVTDQQLSFLDVIRNNVDRMATLVSDLSDISHIETGRITLNLGYTSVDEVVRVTLTGLESRIKQKSQVLELDIDPHLPQVYADSNRLVQVLTNLLNNAHKYTPDKGRLSVSARQIGEFVRISVKDNGIGISAEDQKRLFSQFFRSENPTVREQTGWGLGLNLAHLLVYLMGGEMGMESTLGEGSIFWFTIPISRDQSPTPAG